ncbi:hypothetical protein L7F22_048467 [Adiantum nelumboides]|nr:hypothetical protein [Adiantum nelumboides]
MGSENVGTNPPPSLPASCHAGEREQGVQLWLRSADTRQAPCSAGGRRRKLRLNAARERGVLVAELIDCSVSASLADHDAADAPWPQVRLPEEVCSIGGMVKERVGKAAAAMEMKDRVTKPQGIDVLLGAAGRGNGRWSGSRGVVPRVVHLVVAVAARSSG